MRTTKAYANFLIVCAMGSWAKIQVVRADEVPLETVAQVDLERYLGQWWEIASIPQFFQFGCKNSRARYEQGKEKGSIDVINECERLGLTTKAEGKARAVDDSGAKLKVKFFMGGEGDYWVIDLDADYQWAVVGHPDRDYLWILSRSKDMPKELYESLLQRIEKVHGYDLSKIRVSPRSE